MPEKVIGEYRLVVSEMSWKQQLACSRQFTQWITGGEAQGQNPFEKQVALATMLTLYSDIRLYQDNEQLPPGTYQLAENVTLTLPLTAEGLNNLPLSIAQFLVVTTQEVNPLALQNFLAGATEMLANLSALPSASGQ